MKPGNEQTPIVASTVRTINGGSEPTQSQPSPSQQTDPQSSPEMIKKSVQYLLVGSFFVVFFWLVIVGYSEKRQTAEFSSPWLLGTNILLRPGPSSFHYNNETKTLNYRGFINDKTKESLISLVQPGSNGSPDANVISYWRAIDELAYQSNRALDYYLVILLIVGGASGLLGVQVRSIYDFIGNACYKKELSLEIWWPWYVLRPILGFMLGVVCVMAIEAHIFLSKETPERLWSVAIAFLSGFAVSEFIGRLRGLSKGIFGDAASTHPRSKT